MVVEIEVSHHLEKIDMSHPYEAETPNTIGVTPLMATEVPTP